MKNITEKDIKNCWDTLTIKCYFMLKQIYWKEYALESTKEAPYFLQKKNEDFEEILNETSDVIKRMASK